MPPENDVINWWLSTASTRSAKLLFSVSPRYSWHIPHTAHPDCRLHIHTALRISRHIPHTAHSHCTLTLHTHTAHSHCTLKLHIHTALRHFSACPFTVHMHTASSAVSLVLKTLMLSGCSPGSGMCCAVFTVTCYMCMPSLSSVTFADTQFKVDRHGCLGQLFKSNWYPCECCLAL